jgi:sigma-E factor negative regulatory protein RseA
MTDLNEKLSLLLDDYSEDNIDSTIDEVIDDVNLQYRTRRYRIIGEAMRNELPQAIDTGFHNTVMAQLHDQAVAPDPAPTAAQESAVRHSLLSWMSLKPLAGLAVAASVALVTIALWQPLKQESGQFDEDLVSTAEQQKIQKLAGQQLQAGAVPVSTRVQTPGTRWKVESASPVPGMQQKLNAYLVNHTEQSNSMQGLIPQARVAGFDAQQ